MLRGGPQTSDNSKQQLQQKQKKRLSFKDPEVEGPQRNSFFGGCRSKTLARPTTTRQKVTTTRKLSSSVEDLTLEDQALQIAQHVGKAFSDLSITDGEQASFRDDDFVSSDIERETDIRDSSPIDESYSQPTRGFRISAEDEEFLDSLVPPLQDRPTMRGPCSEYNNVDDTRNCIPVEEPSSAMERSSSSGAQHQIQMLRYQLGQQNQQTQMAMHQIQLLQDQVAAESAARRKSQEQNNQLMQQNKDLLNHMEKLFQQIEDLEKQVQSLEQEKRGKRSLTNHESQAPSLRKPTSSVGYRKPASEQVAHEKPSSSIGYRRPSTEQVHEKPTSYLGYRRPSTEQADRPAIPSRTSFATARKNSLTSTKPLATASKPSPTQNSATIMANRKTPVLSPRSYGAQNKPTDSGAKSKETLRIGDASPPVQSGTLSPFNSVWKLKTPDSSCDANTDKTTENSSRSRTGSFSSFIKKPQETKSTLFSNSFSSTGTTNKKYSSSTSDLYNSPSTFQGKSSLTIEEPSTGVKSAVSNLSLSSTSKLPRYQPYTGWQRRTSLTNDSEPISAISKESYKNTSLFNR